MSLLSVKEYKLYSNFLNTLAKNLNKFYYSKLNKTFVISNKLKGKGYDPVTTSDKAFEKFIRLKIKQKFPSHQVIGEEFGHKKSTSDFTWVIDPIDGTRSYVIGNPTWSNLISLNYKGNPVVGLANFPVLNKYYLNTNNKKAYVFENNKRKKISVSKDILFSNIKVSGAFHGAVSLKQQMKIPKVLKLMQFPTADALSYSHLCEGKIDVVFQATNKIWDIHPLIPIIKAAGGVVTTWDNRDAVNAGNILVSANQLIHNKMLKLLKPVSK
ncbi:inositol monophosphatase [Candidatus Pelagibacter ubique]|nr:inositol monophosphatase family protein [Candidatus Pelagibacter bacterium]MDA7473025.1 inositol monophosphatase [Candidatus Pelagibacter ubique]MDA7481056.1 inositol monophosphatase [Candidatus Pelagibacter ubique]MDA8841354.1 inositol monophosphatase [Candidatus Pelagibacter bacterium]MDC0532045.1 inositol monophosphatase [Candidatus Pelagibacter ubique]